MYTSFQPTKNKINSFNLIALFWQSHIHSYGRIVPMAMGCLSVSGKVRETL